MLALRHTMGAEVYAMAFYEAQAALCGIARYPNLRGTVHFFPKDCGSVVQVSVTGLPRGCGAVSFHGLYIEEGCGCPPLRVRGGGVMPPLLNAGGIAVATFYTAGFRPEDVLGRRIVLAMNADCFERGGGTPIASGVVAPCGQTPAHWPPWQGDPCASEPPRPPCSPWPDCPPPRPDGCQRPAPPCPPPLFPRCGSSCKGSF